MGLPVVAADHSRSGLFPPLPTHMAAALPRASDVVVRFRTAANRSRLPEPLRLFAYIFEAETDQWQWYDEAYGVIAATATDSRPAQRWFGDTQFIRTVNLMTALDQLENEDPAGILGLDPAVDYVH